MDKNELLCYLQSISSLEVALVALNDQKICLEETIQSLNHPISIDPTEYATSPHVAPSKKNPLILRLIMYIAGGLFFAVVLFLPLAILFATIYESYSRTIWSSFNMVMLSAPIAGFIIGFIITLFSDIVNETNQNKELRRINNAIDSQNAHNKRVSEELFKKAILSEEKRLQFEKSFINTTLQPHLNTVNQDIERLTQKLNLLYSTNVLYARFRDLDAVSQIYDYIASGICSDLEGPSGAYAQYMNDYRAGLICKSIDNMGRIIGERLDAIIQNQRRMIINQGIIIHQNLSISQILEDTNSSLSDITNQFKEANSHFATLNNQILDAKSYLERADASLSLISKGVDCIAYNTSMSALHDYIAIRELDGGRYISEYINRI